MHANSARKPWWQQATALVNVSATGAITGLSFVPAAAAALQSPASTHIRLLALEQSGTQALEQSAAQAPAGDAQLRSAIVNVAHYYLRLAAGKTPAEMEQIIWRHDTLDGGDHGAWCAAFASLTLELAARVVGGHSWVSGGSTYPWPLRSWADVRVNPNPSSPGIRSVVQDAHAHHRWHPAGHGYRPLPGDWVVFDGHVEVVTGYSAGVLHSVGGDSVPDYSVNAHAYRDPLSNQGILGFVNNGSVGQVPDSPGGGAAGAPGGADGTPTAGHAAQPGAADRRSAADDASRATTGAQRDTGRVGAAAIPGMPVPAPRPGHGQPHGGQQAGQHTSQVPHDQATAAPDDGGSAGAAGAGHVSTSGDAGPGAQPGIPGTTGQASPSRDAGPGGQPGSPGTNGQTSPPRDASPGGQPDSPGTAGTAGVPGTSSAAPARAARSTDAPGRAAGATDIPGVAGTARSAATAPAGSGQSAARHDEGQAVPRAPARDKAPPPARHRSHSPVPATAPAPGQGAQQAFIREVAPAAVASQRKYGIPASVTIAQAINESGWGRSGLAVRARNLFGIKGTGPAGSQELPTQEYENGRLVTRTAPFRAYRSTAESIDDHGRLLATSGHYRQAMGYREEPDAFAAALTGVYATAPDYGAKLIRLMHRYDLYRYDSDAGTSSGAAARGAAAGTPRRASTAPRGTGADSGTGTASGGTGTASGGTGTAPGRTGTQPGGSGSTPGGATIPGLTAAQTGPRGARPSAPPGSAPPGQAGQPASTRARPLADPVYVQPAHAGPDHAQPDPVQPDPVQPAHAQTAHPRTAHAQTVTLQPGRGRHQHAPYYPVHSMPLPVRNAFTTKARDRLVRAEPLYLDVASHSGISWELLAACDWMQCEARARRSPVLGERLGTLNPDGSIYRTKSAALEQCADDLVALAWAVYRVDLTQRALSVGEVANAFAAFRWGGLLKAHRTSAMEFPYSVAGLTSRHLGMRWPRIGDPNAPDKPGARFRMPFGAVPVVLGLGYPMTA